MRLVGKYASISVLFAVIQAASYASIEAITRGIVHRCFLRLVGKYTSMSVLFAVIEAA